MDRWFDLSIPVPTCSSARSSRPAAEGIQSDRSTVHAISWLLYICCHQHTVCMTHTVQETEAGRRVQFRFRFRFRFQRARESFCMRAWEFGIGSQLQGRRASISPSHMHACTTLSSSYIPCVLNQLLLPTRKTNYCFTFF